MATKIFNATHTGASSTIQLINIQIDSGSKIESQVFPPGYFKLKSQPLADPSTENGWIKLQAVDGSEDFEIESNLFQDKQGNTFANMEAALIYILAFFFEPAALAAVNSIQSQIDSGDIGGGAAFATDISPAKDNISTFRLIPSQATLTTEVGDGNGPYLVSFTESIRDQLVEVGNNDSSLGDGWVSADGGSSLQKVGSGTAQLKFDTDLLSNGDKRLSPRNQPYWAALCIYHQGTPGDDLLKGNAGGAYGCKRENLSGNLNLKINEQGMLDNATGMVIDNDISVDLSDILGNVGWVSNTLYLVFVGRHASGRMIAAVGIIDGTTLELGNLGVRAIPDYYSVMNNADFSQWEINLEENEKLFEAAIGNGPWDLALIKDWYQYFVETYGSFA